MASNLRVDTILPSTGTSLGIGTASGTTTVTNHLNVTGNLGVAGVLTYEDVTNIDSVGVITARSGIRVPAGRVLIGTTTAGDATADDLTIETSGSTGITLRSDSGYAGNIQFADGTSGDDQQRGVLQYHHSDNSMRFMTNASERIRIGSVGQLGIGGANYGTSGQVLTSQGNSSAVQWATPGYGVFDAQHGSSAQSVPVTTWTKIELKGEVADLDGLFDHSSTYRYTPQVAGWYYVAFHFIVTGMGGNSHEMYAAIYKNGGTAVKAHGGGRGGYGGFGQADVYGFVQMNGSSDYLEAYGWQNNTSSAARSVHTTYTRMLGYLVRRT